MPLPSNSQGRNPADFVLIPDSSVIYRWPGNQAMRFPTSRTFREWMTATFGPTRTGSTRIREEMLDMLDCGFTVDSPSVVRREREFDATFGTEPDGDDWFQVYGNGRRHENSVLPGIEAAILARAEMDADEAVFRYFKAAVMRLRTRHEEDSR